ncbi:MAG: hypothetical protein ABIS67_08415 [Candidatus Eisenbacteria bacterium]
MRRQDPHHMARWLARREEHGWSWVELSRRSGHPAWKLRWWQGRLERNPVPEEPALDAETTDPVVAKEAIDRIRMLFQIEAAAKDLSDPARAAPASGAVTPAARGVRRVAGARRDARAAEVAGGPGDRLRAQPVGSVDVLRRRRPTGDLEQRRRASPAAPGRRTKNWLFFQREGGGRTASILMSLLMTAKAAGIHPGDYFKDVLLRIPTCTDARLLTPHGWKGHFEAEVTQRRHALLEQLAGSV